MDWLEFNIHIRSALVTVHDLFDNAVPMMLDLLEPFVNSQRGRFSHWHYLLEPDVCRGEAYCELRLRFEGEKTTLEEIKHELATMLKDYTDQTSISMREDEHLGG